MMDWIATKDKRPDWHCIVKVKTADGKERKAYYYADGAAWLRFYTPEVSNFQDYESKEFLYDVTHWKSKDDEVGQ